MHEKEKLFGTERYVAMGQTVKTDHEKLLHEHKEEVYLMLGLMHLGVTRR